MKNNFKIGISSDELRERMAAISQAAKDLTVTFDELKLGKRLKPKKRKRIQTIKRVGSSAANVDTIRIKYTANDIQ